MISATTAAVVAHLWSDYPTLAVTGTGFQPLESVQVYFNGAVPFGGPSQGSFPASTTADGAGSISVQISMNRLPAPNDDYAITAQGSLGSCASQQGISIPNTIGIPVQPIIAPLELAPVANLLTRDAARRGHLPDGADLQQPGHVQRAPWPLPSTSLPRITSAPCRGCTSR